ncbi:MAG: biotin--[acetyl-CoA-carboxylase] ligase [Bacteroidetes bacterium]|nr:biotin--[acetyl-CoA-carboxylase] ligase [Bacteroidota bacterium]
MFIGAKLIHIPEVDSTNRFAMDLVRNNPPPEGTVIRADFQNAGRGQQGKQWISERGANINASVILYPQLLSASEQFLLNMAVALAVCEAASALCGEPCLLKWPNDVYHAERKLAGILIENSWAGSRWQAAIAGIGLNVNQQEFAGFPATSLRNIRGAVLSQEDCLGMLFQKLEARYLMLRGPRKEQILDDYNQTLMHKNATVKLELQDGRVVSATVLGVSRRGGLLIRTAQGEEQEWHHPQVRIIL